jgi:NAD(P)-dependent dehydrogenase (short-subunit alcohol dehydrogenase family)
MSWIVTGVEAGTGKEVARQLLRKGHHVTAIVKNYLNVTDLTSLYPDSFTAEEMSSYDNSNIISCLKVVFGRESEVDGVILCDVHNLIQATEEMTSLDVNYALISGINEPILLVRALIPFFRKRKKGQIILISAPIDKKVPGGVAISYAIKKGLMAFVESITDEISAYGIRTQVINVRSDDELSSFELIRPTNTIPLSDNCKPDALMSKTLADDDSHRLLTQKISDGIKKKYMAERCSLR